MAKDRIRNKPAVPLESDPRVAFGFIPGYDPSAETVPVDIVSSKDGWSEYTLADGSVIRAKAVLLDVRLAVNQYSPNGDPIYVLQTAFVNQLKVPDNLKKKK